MFMLLTEHSVTGQDLSVISYNFLGMCISCNVIYYFFHFRFCFKFFFTFYVYGFNCSLFNIVVITLLVGTVEYITESGITESISFYCITRLHISFLSVCSQCMLCS